MAIRFGFFGDYFLAGKVLLVSVPVSSHSLSVIVDKSFYGISSIEIMLLVSSKSPLHNRSGSLNF